MMFSPLHDARGTSVATVPDARLEHQEAEGAGRHVEPARSTVPLALLQVDESMRAFL